MIYISCLAEVFSFLREDFGSSKILTLFAMRVIIIFILASSYKSFISFKLLAIQEPEIKHAPVSLASVKVNSPNFLRLIHVLDTAVFNSVIQSENIKKYIKNSLIET